MGLLTDKEITYIKANDPSIVDYRNRIFITIDTSLDILMNTHQVSIEDFEKHFTYIYTNPDKHSYLPESPEKATIFLALNMVSDLEELKNIDTPTLTEKRISLEVGQIQAKLLTVVQNLQEEYVKTKIGIDLNEVSDDQQLSIDRKFPLNFVVYSSAFDKSRNLSNQGAVSKLPPWQSENESLEKRNVIQVFVNRKDQVFLQNRLFEVKKLTDTVKMMIANVDRNPKYPQSAKRAIVSLQNERETDYKIYLDVYNRLKAAYTELWEEKSMDMYGKPYESLSKEEKKKVKQEIPFILTEAEATVFED